MVSNLKYCVTQVLKKFNVSNKTLVKRTIKQ